MFRFWPHYLLVLILAANAYAFRHELSNSRVDLNDNVFHYTLIERMVESIEHRQNPFDFWVPEWGFGYPVFRTYQPLAHLFAATTYFALGKTVSLRTVFVWIRYLLLVLLPLSFFLCARLLSLPPPSAVAAALLVPLIASNGLYGLESDSFVWAGLGLYTQLFAVHLLLLGIGLSFRALRSGRGLTLAGLVLGLTFLGHMLYGYVGLITTLLIAALELRSSPQPAEENTSPRIADLQKQGWRLLWIWAAAGLVAGFQLLSLISDRGIVNHSPWEPSWKWDSLGPAAVLRILFTGELLDHGRLPVLSLMALIGVVAFAWFLLRGTEPAAAPLSSWTFIASGALLWTLLYCGRPLWGPALLLLGITSDFQIHRFAGAVQIFLILLAGVGLAQLWTWIGARRAVWRVLATLLILIPALRERGETLAAQAAWGKQNLEAFEYAEPTLEVTIRMARYRGDRVYAGLPNGWGAQFKIGSVPFYSFLGPREVPAVSYLYHAMSLAGDFMVRFDENNPVHYRLFNVRTLAAEQANLDFVQPVSTLGRFRLWNTPTNGYFDLVDIPFAVSVDKDQFFDVNDRWLRSNWVGQNQHLAIDMEAPVPQSIRRLPRSLPLPSLPQPQAFGTISGQHSDRGSYSAEIEALRPCYLLFKMSWHPNWSVYVDGVRSATLMLSPGFLGVPVKSGKHEVTCRYEPGIGRLVAAIAGLLLVLAMMAWERKRAERSRH